MTAITILAVIGRVYCPYRPSYLKPFFKEETEEEIHLSLTKTGFQWENQFTLLLLQACGLVVRIVDASILGLNLTALIGVATWVVSTSTDCTSAL